MTQQIINIGAAPNDGEGDNLRTAFDKVNENFSNVWAQGPVDSNVQIQGNTISTLQVNQDLALSPNGVGNVRLNNNTIPGANNTWFLGSTTNRWRGLFVGNVVAGNISTVNLNVPGDAYIGGNLTVVGDTIQIGNITTDTLTIQLANTALTDAAANGAGITVGANDDIATFLYDAGNNVWTTNIGLQVDGAITGTSIAVSDATIYGNVDAINGNFTGNVTANYFVGDGSQLSNITGANVVGLANVAYTGDYNDLSNIPTPYGDSNVTTLLSSFGSNTIITTGNITAGYFLGNGSQLTGIQTGAVISNTAPTLGTGGIWWNSIDGRAYVKYANAFIDLSPSLVPDPTTYVGNVSFDDIDITNVGNIIPAANAVYSLGSAAFQWSNLWVANNTIYLGGVPVGITAANVLTVGGEEVLSNNSAVSITTTGNITADNIFVVASITASGGASPAPSISGFESISAVGNITGGNITATGNVAGDVGFFNDVNINNVTTNKLLYANDDRNVYDTNFGYESATGNISGTGNITTTANVTAAYFIGDGSQLTGLPPGYTDSDVATFLAAYGSNTISTTGNITAGNFVGAGSNVDIVAGAYDWTFGNDGNLLLPGNTFAVKYANGVAVSLGGNYGDSNVVSLMAAFGSNTISTTGNITGGYILGNAAFMTGIPASYGNANVVANLAALGANPISSTANITTTGNVSGAYVLGNGSQLTAVNAVTVDVTNTNGLATTYYPTFVENRTTAQIARADVDLSYRTDTNTLTVGNISSGGNITAAYFIGNGSALTGVTVNTVGNITGTSSNVDIIAGAYQWTFNNTGNLVLPGNTFAVNYANGTAVSLGGGGGTPGGANTNVQFNDGGSFNGTAGLTFNKTSNALVSTGNVTGANVLTSGNGSFILNNSNGRIRQTGSNATISLGDSITLTPDTASSPLNGVIIGGLGYLLAPDSSRNAVLNYGGNSGVMGINTVNIYGATATAIVNGGSSGVGNIGGNTTNRFNTAFLTSVDASGNVTAGNVITTGNVSGNVNGFAIGYRDIPVLSLAANTTVSTSDAGKQYYSTSASPLTLTIANNASQAFQTGATINIVNQGAGNVSVLRDVGVTMYLAGNSTSSDRTLTSYGVASVTKVATDTWFISGVGLI